MRLRWASSRELGGQEGPEGVILAIVLLGALGALLGPLGALLEASWEALGSISELSWGSLGMILELGKRL